MSIRRRTESRTCLDRSKDTIETAYGTLEVKKIIRNGNETVYPEYESAKKLAAENGVALREIYKMK